VTSSKRGVEERLAAKLAKEVLLNNPNLKNVHSSQSIKKLLEKEARKQIDAGGP